MKLWMLRNPKGKDIAVFTSKADAWFASFLYQSDKHQHIYWQQPEQSQRRLKKLGWTVVRGKFVED